MFECPDLTARGIVLRAACVEDAPFERALFEASRPDAALLAAAMPDAARKPFLDQQFQFQSVHYARAHPDADRLLIVAAGAPIGRMIVHRRPEGWCIVDIALVPAWRGKGIGTLLLQCVQEAAARAVAGLVELSVEVTNPARRLYERLGFSVVAESFPNAAMAWRPTSGQLKTA